MKSWSGYFTWWVNHSIYIPPWALKMLCKYNIFLWNRYDYSSCLLGGVPWEIENKLTHKLVLGLEEINTSIITSFNIDNISTFDNSRGGQLIKVISVFHYSLPRLWRLFYGRGIELTMHWMRVYDSQLNSEVDMTVELCEVNNNFIGNTRGPVY